MPDSPFPSLFQDLSMEDRAQVAMRVWAILVGRLTPQFIAALSFINSTHPTTTDLAERLNISVSAAANLARILFKEGFIVREKDGRSYRYRPAFPPPLPWHYFDHSPVVLTGEAAEYAAEILERRGLAGRTG